MSLQNKMSEKMSCDPLKGDLKGVFFTLHCVGLMNVSYYSLELFELSLPLTWFKRALLKIIPTNGLIPCLL